MVLMRPMGRLAANDAQAGVHAGVLLYCLESLM